MLQKNIEKQKRKIRRNWVGFYQRRTPTKAEIMKKKLKKYKKSIDF